MKKCPIEEKHESMGKDIERCIICHKKIGKSQEEKTREKIKKVPKETRQRILDLAHEGKTIGEIKEEVKLDDTMVVAGILLDNVGTIQFLKKEAI